MKRLIVLLIGLPVWLRAQQRTVSFTDRIPAAIFSLSKVMMHDVVNPPAASRYYAYCMMGAYEITSQHDTAVRPIGRLIGSYSTYTLAADKKSYDYRIAALYCILETGKLLLPSGFMLEDDEKKLVSELAKTRIPPATIQASVAVAIDMAAHIISWSKKDNYGKLSAKLRYTPLKGDAYWYPTPPAYIEAVEPNWKTIRPLVIDSATQFIPLPPIAFSKDSNSAFYRQAVEVYQTAKALTPVQLHIASFWDCNPFVVSTAGHMSIGFKKISPGGHWMSITGIAVKKAGLSFNSSVILHTMVAVTLMDAFISCWEEKYRSNRIRPETYINRYIDIKWQPLLQTPPFPEYTSGHSVISAAAAGVLTHFLGDHFAYTDNSEVIFEIAARSFTSFNQAAAEAAISRLYGGIHFRDAIENGQQEGRAVGMKIVEKIQVAGIKITGSVPGTGF